MNEDISPETILEQALGLSDLRERIAYLDEACGENESLRAEIESLLAAAFAADADFMDTLIDPVWSEIKGEQEGDTIGRYKLLQQIGEGGFGTVYMAEQTEPVKRRVALKVIKAGMDSKEIIARFEAERQALALMDHPNIAKVYDAGTTEGGRPYFVMELVKGVPITKYCAEQDLDTKARLVLFADVCAAVQHAHQKGIIHRDLKPSNIMVSPHDGKPVVKVIDFGIAKAISLELTEKKIFTQLGRMIGTPQYMSPEQADLNARDVDTRSDIYSLGVVLYELLTGTTPLDGEQLRSAAYGEMQRLVREETPPKPSTRVSTTRHSRPSSKPGHAPDHRSLRGDLDWIVMKALEKDRTRRYETASGFALDVRRYLEHEPVDAGPPGIGYRTRKFVQRNKVVVAATLAVSLALVIGTTASITFALRANREKQTAQLNEGLGWLLQAEVAEKDGSRYPETLFYAARAIGFDGLGETDGDLPGLPPLIRKEQNPEEYRQALDWIRSRPHYLPVWNSGTPPTSPRIDDLTLSAAGRWLGVRSVDGSVRLWDFTDPDASEIGIPSNADDSIRAIALHPAGRRVALAGAERVSLWDLETRTLVHEIEASVEQLTFSPGGESLAGTAADGSILIWQGEFGAARRFETTQSTAASDLAFSPDGTLLAVLHAGSAINLLFCGESRESEQLHRSWENWATFHPVEASRVNAIAFSPDGASLALGLKEGCLSLWDVATARAVSELASSSRKTLDVLDLSFGPDGTLLASVAADGTIALWEREDDEFRHVATLAGQAAPVTRIAFIPGGMLLASTSADGNVMLWDVSGRTRREACLAPYIENKWCRFNPRTQKPEWQVRKGFLNLPSGSPVDLWQQGEAAASGLLERMIESDGWTGGVSVAGTREEAGRREFAAVLLAKAEEAIGEKRWSSARLHLRQWESLADRDGDSRAASIRAQLPAVDGADFSNHEGIRMIWCPAGTFTMGSPADEEWHRPEERQREVIIHDGFWIAQCETTVAQFQKLMDGNPTQDQIDDGDLPALVTDWKEAMEFCRRLTDLSRARGTITSDMEYNLPSQAQWEYACRAGTSTPWSFGSDKELLPKYAWCRGNSGFRPKPVGTREPNPWGLHDMHGNYWEWCVNRGDGPAIRGEARGPGSANLRGGSCFVGERRCRSAIRTGPISSNRAYGMGFRPTLIRIDTQ